MSVEAKEAFLKERRRISEATRIPEDQLEIWDVEMCAGVAEESLSQFIFELRHGDVSSNFEDAPDFRAHDIVDSLSADLRSLVRPAETSWSLERNAAAAGFFVVADYLRWRREGGLDS
jgi:hypothetical protein